MLARRLQCIYRNIVLACRVIMWRAALPPPIIRLLWRKARLFICAAALCNYYKLLAGDFLRYRYNLYGR